MSNKTQTWLYVAVLAACVAIVFVASYTGPGKRLNDVPYDTMLSTRAAEADGFVRSAVVAIDEDTLRARGGMYAIRSILAGVVNRVNAADPAAVADDIVLADETPDVGGNAALEAAFSGTKNLILPCDEDRSGKWEDPLPRFARSAVALCLLPVIGEAARLQVVVGGGAVVSEGVDVVVLKAKAAPAVSALLASELGRGTELQGGAQLGGKVAPEVLYRVNGDSVVQDSL